MGQPAAVLKDQEPTLSLTEQSQGFNSDQQREAGRLIRTGIRSSLAEAVAIKRLIAQTAELIASGDVTEELSERARAVDSISRAFERTCETIRVLRGKPLPGQKRPLPDAPKAKPSKKRVGAPQLQPRPVQAPSCGQDTTTPSVPPLVPDSKTTQEQ